MKTVFKSKEGVFAAFMEQSNRVARTGKDSYFQLGRLFTETNVLYSYGFHYVLARSINGVVVINNVKSSNTTERQKCELTKYLSKINVSYVYCNLQDVKFYNVLTDILCNDNSVEYLSKILHDVRNQREFNVTNWTNEQYFQIEQEVDIKYSNLLLPNFDKHFTRGNYYTCDRIVNKRLHDIGLPTIRAMVETMVALGYVERLSFIPCR